MTESEVPAMCPGCDGDGGLMVCMAKQRCREVGGYRQDLPAFAAGLWWAYYTPDGKEIEYKTISGHCPVCKGLTKKRCQRCKGDGLEPPQGNLACSACCGHGIVG